jgi:glycosyltransferase involved in cell wall biosynthesis
MAKPPRRLLVVSHVVHYRHHGRLSAYAPYVREMDVWCDLFPEILIASPCRDEPPPDDCAAFERTNITVLPQREAGGETLRAKIALLFALPQMLWGMCRAMRRADAIHVRCPGNFGLLGVCLAPLFSRRRIAKYAGQWTAYPGEARTVALQRRLLASRWWNSPVTVYGDWANQPLHVVPFFTSVLTKQQVEQAKLAAANSRRPRALRVVFVGRLSAAKNVDVLIKAIAEVRRSGAEISAAILGTGPMRDTLERLVQDLQLNDCVKFVGGVEFDRVLEHYAASDVLVLASETEGWPKAIAEAMAFGLVCIGSRRGLIPQMLADGRGFLVEPGDVPGLAQLLLPLARCPENFVEMRRNAAEWGQRYSLESLREALRDLMETHWQTQLMPLPSPENAPNS